MIILPFDGQVEYPAWSPDGSDLVFSGKPAFNPGYQLYLAPSIGELLESSPERIRSGFVPRVISSSSRSNLAAVWSPNGKSIAYQALEEEQGVENWGINVVNINRVGSSTAREISQPIRLTNDLWEYEESLPSWDTEGRRIAFYVSNARINETGGNDNQQIDVSILAVTRDRQERVMAGLIAQGQGGNRVQEAVQPNSFKGPAWLNQGSSTFLLYVKRDAQQQQPIETTNINIWSNPRETSDPHTTISDGWGTIEHSDVTIFECEKTGGKRIVYVSQVGGQLQLQVKDLGNVNSCVPSLYREPSWTSNLVPGLPLVVSKRNTVLGSVLAGVSVAGLSYGVVSGIQYSNEVSDYEDTYQDERLGLASRGTADASSIEEAYGRVQNKEPNKALRTAAIVGVAGYAGLLIVSAVLNRDPTRRSTSFSMLRYGSSEQGRIQISPEMDFANGRPAFGLTSKIRF